MPLAPTFINQYLPNLVAMCKNVKGSNYITTIFQFQFNDITVESEIPIIASSVFCVSWVPIAQNVPKNFYPGWLNHVQTEAV